MTSIADGESGSSVRTKLNTALAAIDALQSMANQPTTSYYNKTSVDALVAACIDATELTAALASYLTAAAAALAYSAIPPAYVAGNWYGFQKGVQAANVALAADTIYYVPFFIPRAITASDIGCRITTLFAGGNIKLAIYANTNGVPTGTPLAETGNISTAATGAVSADITGANVTLQPGLYWAAFWADNSTVVLSGVTTTTIDDSAIMVGATGLSTIIQNTSVGWINSSSETYGTWPNATTETLTPIATSTANRRYLIFLKAA